MLNVTQSYSRIFFQNNLQHTIILVPIINANLDLIFIKWYKMLQEYEICSNHVKKLVILIYLHFFR